MKYDCYKNDTYNLYTINTSKFRSVHMELIFRSPASKENITYLALLTDMLTENSKLYPTKKELTRKMYDLYNVNFYATNTRVGGSILTNFILEFLDPKYTESDIPKQAIELFFEMIFNPNVENGEFDSKTFDRLKSILSKEIEAIKENPKQSSILSAFNELDKDDLRSLNSSGNQEVLDSITPKKLYKYYEDFLENTIRDIYIVGNVDMDEIDKTIKQYAKFKSIPTNDEKIYLENIENRNSKTVAVDSSQTQTNLVQIYTMGSLNEKEKNYVVPLFNIFWGSGSLESKLYKSLREENSLCYNVSTFYQKYDKVLILHTAIDDENTNLSLKLIKNSLNSIIKGEITEQELENVKNLLITSLYLILDSPNRLIDSYLFKNIADLPDIEERIDEFKKITTEDIISFAKKLKLILTYRVRGE